MIVTFQNCVTIHIPSGLEYEPESLPIPQGRIKIYKVFLCVSLKKRSNEIQTKDIIAQTLEVL